MATLPSTNRLPLVLTVAGVLVLPRALVAVIHKLPAFTVVGPGKVLFAPARFASPIPFLMMPELLLPPRFASMVKSGEKLWPTQLMVLVPFHNETLPVICDVATV